MEINRIEDLLPAIKDKPEFIIMDKGDYKVIDYIYQDTHTFDDPRCLECRGIKFDKEGNIIARPLKKFFNLGEKEHPDQIDWSKQHSVLEKLDGSLIHPCIINKELVLMTKAGVTEVAKLAMERFLNKQNYRHFFLKCLESGLTPSMEFTAPDNRIVLYYPESALTLLAIRETVSGEYISLASMVHGWALIYDIPVISGLLEPITDILQFIQHVRDLKGKEGYVIRFKDGHMLKIKADDYLLKHRAKSELDSKKKILHVVLRNGVDDLLPLLGPEDQTILTKFADNVYSEINRGTAEILDLVNRYGHSVDRKTFATKIVRHLEPWLKGAAFRHLDGMPPREAIVNSILSRDGRSVVHEEYIKTKWNRQQIEK